ncbi:ABC transporter permease [Dolichospermum sp. ST_sed1]|nr:ABC transporter permease [Dolichospermum sp. ST_sed1]
MFVIIIKRLFTTIPTLLALTIALFLMVKAIPGDPAQLMLGDKATAESLAEMREEMGLNKPVLTQYGIYLYKLIVEGDMGRSITTQEPVFEIILDKFPATIELALAAILCAIFIGIPMGLAAAVKPGSMLDFTSMSFAVFGVSMPVFWLGLILMWIFGMQLEWLPISGRLSIDFYYTKTTGFLLFDSLFIDKDMEMFWSAVHHLILPAITLGTIPMAYLARITRSSMLEISQQDYIRTAKAKGATFLQVYLKHTLKNAAIPIITILGLQFGALLAGAMITETIFSWPGMGRWILESVGARDIPSIEGGVLIVAIAFVMINLVVDLLYRIVDPRIRLS